MRHFIKILIHDFRAFALIFMCLRFGQGLINFYSVNFLPDFRIRLWTIIGDYGQFQFCRWRVKDRETASWPWFVFFTRINFVHPGSAFFGWNGMDLSLSVDDRWLQYPTWSFGSRIRDWCSAKPKTGDRGTPPPHLRLSVWDISSFQAYCPAFCRGGRGELDEVVGKIGF